MVLRYILLILATLLWAHSANAHFTVETQSREIHVLQTENNGNKIILRFPLTLAYANELARRRPGANFTAPFMKTELVAGVNYYKIDSDAVAKNPAGFINFLLRDYNFSLHGQKLMPEKITFALVDTHIQPSHDDSLESGLSNSRKLLAKHAENRVADFYISDALVIVSLQLPNLGQQTPLKIELTSDAFPVPESMFFETHISDHRKGLVKLLSFRGVLFPPVHLAGSFASSLIHFVNQGVHHILVGFDHVLFVLCLVLAAGSLSRLLWSVTGFTTGHSITLAAGVLGYVPQGNWFIPLIELLVAASILLIGALVLLQRKGMHGFWLAAIIGLLHGFGFSFLLAEMLDGSAMIGPLIGFNIGVELGQIAIVIVVYTILNLISRQSKLLDSLLRYGVVLFACVMAAQMIAERSIMLNQALSIQAKKEHKMTLVYIESHYGGGSALFNEIEKRDDAIVVRQPELTVDHLQNATALISTMHLDQLGMLAFSDQLEKFLNRGGRWFFNGHMMKPLVAGLQIYQYVCEEGISALELNELNNHPIFTGVDRIGLRSRKGVTGFYGRGSNPMPVGATAITGVGSKQAPLDWEWKRPGGGRIFSHAGNDLQSTALSKEDTVKLTQNIIAWTMEENIT